MVYHTKDLTCESQVTETLSGAAVLLEQGGLLLLVTGRPRIEVSTRTRMGIKDRREKGDERKGKKGFLLRFSFSWLPLKITRSIAAYRRQDGTGGTQYFATYKLQHIDLMQFNLLLFPSLLNR